MKLTPLLTLTLLGGAVAFGNPYQSQQEEMQSVVATGQKAASELIKTLGSNLKKELQANGPVAAAKFCSANAFSLTSSVGDAFGETVSVKRVSLKERNPSNRPEADEKAVLEALQSLKEAGVVLPEYLVQQSGADSYKYYKPLSINKEVCLKCHGEMKNKELGDYLHEIYPADKATGYRMGDLRGAIVVEIRK